MINKFVELGINNNWCSSYIDSLKKDIQIPDDNKCPISFTELDSFAVITKCKHCFNLKYIVKWLIDKDDCPICRNKISSNELKFFKENDFNMIYELIIKQGYIIICDELWYRSFPKKEKIIHELDFIENSIKNTNYKIFNLSNLNNHDIAILQNKKLIFADF